MWEEDLIEQKISKNSKFILWGTSMYISAEQIIAQTLYRIIFRENRVRANQYIMSACVVSQGSSIASVASSLIIDAQIGIVPAMSVFLFIVVVPLLLIALADTSGLLSAAIAFRTLKVGAASMSLYYILSPVDRAVASKQIKPYSPLLRNYFFKIFYLSVIFQFIVGALLQVPSMCTMKYEIEYSWFTFGVQAALWIAMLCSYAGFLLSGKEESTVERSAFKVVVCLHFAACRTMMYFLRRLRNRDADLPAHPFDGCGTRFSNEVVDASKKLLRLFALHLSLSYYHGSEAIIGLISFNLDYGMNRSSLWNSTPLTLIYLIFLLVFYPVSEYVIIPITKRLGIFSDLRLVGAASLLFGLSYVLASVLETLVEEDTDFSSISSQFAVMVFNFLPFPVMWIAKMEPGAANMLQIPSYGSRVYRNTDPGVLNSSFSSIDYLQSYSTDVELGDSKHIMLKHNGVFPIPELDIAMQSVPSLNFRSLSVFCRVMVSRNDLSVVDEIAVIAESYSRFKLLESISKVTGVASMHIPSGVYNITLQLKGIKNQTQFITKNRIMKTFAVYFIAVHTSPNGSFAATITEVRSGFSYSRLLTIPHLAVAALAVSLGKVSINIYTYEHAPPQFLATSFSFQNYAGGISVFLYWWVRSITGVSFAGITAFGILIFVFSILFIYIAMRDDFKMDDELDVFDSRMANTMED